MTAVHTYPKDSRLAIALLTALVVAVHGYHPFAEDGGLYLAGIRKLLDPTLYPLYSAFVTEHLRFSVFAPVVAALVRLSHLSVESVLLLLYLTSVGATLTAAWALAARLTQSFHAQLGGVTLLACWAVLPVAGTSLMLTDPYLTARSVTTPLSLAVICCMLDALHAPSASLRWRSLGKAVAALTCAALLHPLMAGYALALTLTIAAAGVTNRRRRWLLSGLLAGLALTLAAALQWRAAAESADYVRIALTRYYWFPFAWHWYEQLGLIAPLAVLVWLGRLSRPQKSELATACITLALIALAVGVIFCREHLLTHLVARLQPLRAFQLVYLVMIIMLGVRLAETWLKQHRWRWAVTVAALSGLMFIVARATYPASDQVELPFGSASSSPRNPWERAFLWIARETPKDALFALDAHYITREGEDAQLFRAPAQRSSLPDYSKDGGEASITPSLTDAWVTGQSAETGLDLEGDATRRDRLIPLGVSWIVLKAGSKTSFPCPYQNEAVKACQLTR